jgi:three-Cys-motif partner protein
VTEYLASDGLPARDSGPWAAQKHRQLDRYMDMVSTAMKGKNFPGGVVFVDLMAGPGICLDSRTVGTPETDGSTLRALKTRFPFTRVIAVESNADYAAALRERVSQLPRAATCTVELGDCNSRDVIAKIRKGTDRALTLMFVDLLGTEVQMRTLRALTNARTADLLITWPEMDATRNVTQMFDQEERWSAFFGTSEWKTILRSHGPMTRLKALRALYCAELAKLGYLTEFAPPIRNLKGGRLYRPLFASRKQLGMKFWGTAVGSPAAPKLFE